MRMRIHKLRKMEGWSLEELFKTVDKEETGSISVFDLERLIMETKKGQASTGLVQEIELIIAMYDKTGFHKITFADFSDQLTPKIC